MPPPGEESDTSTAEAPEISAEEAPGKRPPGHVRETVVIIVLSITAVLTAWCGFESSKWSGKCPSPSARRPAPGSRPRGRKASPRRPAGRPEHRGVHAQARSGRHRTRDVRGEALHPHFQEAYRAWIAQRNRRPVRSR